MRSQYALFGHPVAHSLSPDIHAQFATGLGIAMDYSAIDAPAGTFARQLTEFAEAGGAGANVTLPLKQQVPALCSELTEHARRSGAVNTLVRTASGWRGDNTDGRVR